MAEMGMDTYLVSMAEQAHTLAREDIAAISVLHPARRFLAEIPAEDGFYMLKARRPARFLAGAGEAAKGRSKAGMAGTSGTHSHRPPCRALPSPAMQASNAIFLYVSHLLAYLGGGGGGVGGRGQPLFPPNAGGGPGGAAGAGRQGVRLGGCLT